MGRYFLMAYRTGILRELPASEEGIPCLRLRLRTKACRGRLFVMASASLLMFGATSHTAAAVCRAIDGTQFSASKTVADTFFLALQFCRESKTSGMVQDFGHMASLSMDASRYSAKGTANSASPEAQQLSLYDAEDTAGIIMKASLPVSSRGWAHPLPAYQKNLQVTAEYFGPRAKILASRMHSVAENYNIDPLLLHAIAHVESRHDPQAVSPAGALGLMQVMPTTARRFGVNDPERELHDPRVNLEVSSIYLKKLQGLFGNDLRLVLAAYNAGENAVIKYGRQIPPYRETQAYVRDVMGHYMKLKGLH